MTDAPTVTAPDNEFAADLAEAWKVDEAAEKPEAPAEDPKKPEEPAAGEEPKKDEPAKPEDPKKPDEGTPPAGDEKKPEEGDPAAKDPKAPVAPEEPAAPLTKDDVEQVISKLRTDERVSAQNMDVATKEVMDAYYPEGLSNVLVDQKSGKELKSPQDVVDASGGEMSTEEAAQWLMNEQYKLDQNIAKIQKDAEGIAATTVKFKQDAQDVLQRYDPLFKAYPTVQQKVWDQYIKLVKADEKKGVILSAPDMREFYDTMLDPYRMAFEYANKQSATNPTGDDPKKPDEPAKPGSDDRLDEGGDGGVGEVDDPNDFAQQVGKELKKGL